MPMKRIALLLGATIALIAVILSAKYAGLESAIYAFNFMSPSGKACDSVVIVGIDPQSTGSLGTWPWPRSTQAALIDAINQGSPRTVALDFLFVHSPDSAGSDSLSRVFSRVNGLVLPFRIESFVQSVDNGSAAMPADIYQFRFLRLANAPALRNTTFYQISQATPPDTLMYRWTGRSGFLNISTRKGSQLVTEVIHVIKAGDEYYPSFGLAAAASFMGVKPDEFVLDGKSRVALGATRVPISTYAATTFLHFRGPGGAIKTVSAGDVLSGKIDKSTFTGKLVFVGITDPAVNADFLITPVGTDYPGVEIWGTAASDILQKRWITGGGAGSVITWLLVLLIFPGLVLIAPARMRIPCIIGAGVVAAASVAMMFVLFASSSYFWDPSGHIIAFIAAAFWLGFQKSTVIIRQSGVDLEPRNLDAASTLKAPADNELLAALPDTETAEFVAREIKRGLPPAAATTGERTMVEHDVAADVAAESAVLDKFRDLCGGKIVRVLGSGGMADVYLIWNPRLEVYRAVKVIKPGKPVKFTERFETEVKILSKLNHPNIVQCYSAGEWHGLSYLEMEYINGVSIDAIMEKCRKLSPEETLAVGICICRALHYAHQKVVSIYGKTYSGVIHRDLKPANIMVGRNGEIKLTDFGIARPAQVHLHTVDAGTVVGTLPYLAPEQVDGRTIDARTDIYALGVTLYEFLMGERALPQQEVTALLSAKSTGNIKPLSLDGAASADIARVINKSMAVNPDERYATAADMARDLEKALTAVVKTDAWKVLEQLSKRQWG